MNREGHLTKRLLISKGERWVVWIYTPGSVLNIQLRLKASNGPPKKGHARKGSNF